MSPVDLEPYRKAIRERICSFCLYHIHEGECTRPADDSCALDTHLDVLVRKVLDVEPVSEIEPYVASLRLDLCPNCREDADGNCPMRDLAHCALDSYVIPVIEVIEDVAAAEGHRKA